MMKRSTLIKAVLTLTFMVCGLNALTQVNEEADTANARWETLICAISAVESSGNPNAVNGKHVGFLQISPILVDECNRILKTKKYSYKDRYSKEKSIEMFNVFQNFYNPEHNIEKAIRMWNGGPRYRTGSTNGYFRKVMKVFNRLVGN